MTSAEFQWIVGFYEGEGTCYITRNYRQPILKVYICQRDPTPLLWIKSKLAGCVSNQKKSPTSFSQKKMYVWSVACKKARTFLQQSIPFMHSKYKISQAKRVLREEKPLIMLEGRRKRRKDGTFRKRRNYAA